MIPEPTLKKKLRRGEVGGGDNDMIGGVLAREDIRRKKTGKRQVPAVFLRAFGMGRSIFRS